MDPQTKNLEAEKNPAEAAERFRRLVESWMAEGPAYEREVWPALKEGLDRNRPEYRKHSPYPRPRVNRRLGGASGGRPAGFRSTTGAGLPPYRRQGKRRGRG